MKSFTVEGIIIKRSNRGETDKLITLYTPTHGKFSAIAKGIRKITSRRAGSLELFNHVRASVVVAKDLEIITEVKLLESYSTWKQFLGRTIIAYQMVEVIDKLCPEKEPHPEVFSLLRDSFLKISLLKSDWESESKSWVVRLVQLLGYLPPDELFSGDISKFIEEIILRPIHSSKFIRRLQYHG